jgi:hypothetical protein
MGMAPDYPHPEIVRHLQAWLVDCGGHLCSYYADQVLDTGIRTTPEDAFAAWSRWLAAEGGTSERPLKVSDWANGFHDRTARAIREVARYV